jgi:hypothetical protein
VIALAGGARRPGGLLALLEVAGAAEVRRSLTSEGRPLATLLVRCVRIVTALSAAFRKSGATSGLSHGRKTRPAPPTARGFFLRSRQAAAGRRSPRSALGGVTARLSWGVAGLDFFLPGFLHNYVYCLRLQQP